jgi:glycosyltransferase involved in cell wall biosynthesis
VNKHGLPFIIIFSPSAHGGIAEHTFYQAKALERAGAKILCLGPTRFLAGRETGFKTIACLPGPVAAGGRKAIRQMQMVWRIVVSRLVLACQIIKRRPDLVLLDSYVEYLAPLWIWPHWLLSRLGGVKYAANLHDPVRNYVVGPKWWHKLSVRMAYWPLDFVLVHGKLTEPSPVPAHVRVVQVPHGVYEISGSPVNAAEIRRSWDVKMGQKVFLAFGYVRDGKNLDLAICALAQVPEAFLVVAGSVASNNDKPFAFYSELAASQGVTERCKLFEGFVAEDELGKYFAATDFVLLTYSSSFHSQSGVLNLAARARKPVLASAAPGPLIESVKNFNLGVAVAPDSVMAIVHGMTQLLLNPPSPCWEDYEAVSSWATNANGILEAAGCRTSSN